MAGLLNESDDEINEINNQIIEDEIDGIDGSVSNFTLNLNGERSVPPPPPETEWYHGRLDRFSAEQRLKAAYKLGSYLVRESDRKPGSYVLSYLGKTGINHFRIAAVCGDFYIGGRQFFSLSDLVAYYSCNDLLKRERLIHAIAPPEPVSDTRRVVAILPYTKMPDTDELSFQKGDIFFVHNNMGDGWIWTTKHRTGEQGMIFSELVEDLEPTIDPNTVFSWFHPNCTKNEAVDMLVKNGPGSFLVRPSDNSPGDYSLFFHINNQIQRFRIEKKGVRYLMGGRTFECLDAVINRYRKEQIVEGHTLQNPVMNSSCQTESQQQSAVSAAAEKIYATLRECRDQNMIKKIKGIKQQGYLTKRSEKTGKWKQLYFALINDGAETHLFFYDSPKKTKPKGLIDLSCAYLYQVHESLWERSNCFQLVERALPCLATITHLCDKNSESYQEWIAVLKQHCRAQFSRAQSKLPRLRELRCLNLQVLEAHRIPFKLVPHCFVTIALNQIKIAKTKVKSTPDPIFEEEFVIDDLPIDIATLNMTLVSRAKRNKDSDVAELTIDLATSLKNGAETENWYDLNGITPIGEWGSLRLRIRYMDDLVMPAEEYSPLQELLLENEFHSVRALSDLCHSNRIPLASSLLKIFRHEKKECELMRSLCQAEVARESDTSTLFRATSLATTLMDIYMRSESGLFLQSALSDTIQKLLESKQSAELNPTKMEVNDDACTNAEFLLLVLDQITQSIFTSIDACPRGVRYICSCLQKAVVQKWPGERLVRTRVVSGFIFLRLLCPALLNPRQFGLVQEQPSQMATRSLIMIAKCLQNLANLIEFGGKGELPSFHESYMEVVNPFILKNKERMIVFLDQLSNVSDPFVPSSQGGLDISGNMNAMNSSDTGRELATLHHICVSHLTELQNMSKVNVSIKKLVTVTEMLSKHKLKYLEMINEPAR